MIDAGAEADGLTPTTGVVVHALSVSAAPSRQVAKRVASLAVTRRPPPLSARAGPPATRGPRRPRSPAGSSRGWPPQPAATRHRRTEYFAAPARSGTRSRKPRP